MNKLQLLKKTREIFADHGGAKHLLRNDDGLVCLRGALYEAATGDPCRTWDFHPITGEVDDLLNDLVVAPALSFGRNDHVNFNNAPETTKEDVLDLIDVAISCVMSEVEE